MAAASLASAGFCCFSTSSSSFFFASLACWRFAAATACKALTDSITLMGIAGATWIPRRVAGSHGSGDDNVLPKSNRRLER